MSIPYKSKLFLYFFAVFALFTAIVLFYQQIREKRYKQALIETKMDIYTHIIAEKENEKEQQEVLPANLRITIINNGGKVLYDNQADSVPILENHFDRPEIQKAKTANVGSDIRLSESLDVPFLYYARKTADGYVRVALPYNVETQLLLKTDKTFLVLSLSLFLLSILFLWLIARQFGLDVERLKTDIIRQQQARAALKTELTSSIAHELRTPVSAIRGYMETLIDPEIPDEKRIAFINRAHLASIRLSELLQDVSLLTKMEESGRLFTKERIDLYEMAEKVREEFEESLHANSVKIENLIPEGSFMYGNSMLIYSIFRNLIENAINYAGKWITITIEITKSDDKCYYLTVSDTGNGIPEAYLPRIFERFFRVNDGRSREDGGSGLGLAIVHHAVLYHEGEVTAENKSGGGLQINFSLKKA
ncbi:MAG: HAMP domain-containing histidine kinase [Lentimicrobiaceae bacterium]|jgi:signal transduction histidine kinase|nr:HAMP domain-containing histidine kinase [Lentimicrobiaceae bacterium]